MPRSLRAWLASLALIAFPGLALPSYARAQTFMGPPHMAPVALEARSMLSDGINGRIAGLVALGADPLESSILLADAAADDTESSASDAEATAAEAKIAKAAAGKVDTAGAKAAKQHVDEGIPACYVECPAAREADALEESLAALATEEPLDVAVSPTAAAADNVPVGCGGLRLATDVAGCAVQASDAEQAPDDSASRVAVAEKGAEAEKGAGAESRELANCEWDACDWDAHEWDASEWDECSELAKWSELAECGALAGRGEPAASEEAVEIAAVESGDEVKGSDVAESQAGTADSAEGSRFVGSSPVIAVLEEEYLPYDLSADEPLRLRLLPFSVRRSCPLENRPLVAAIAPGDKAATAAAASAPKAAVTPLVNLAPSGIDWVALSRWVDSLQPRMPVHCWMEEVIWQVNEALDPRGPIRSRLQAEQIGHQVAEWGIQLEQHVAAAAEPVMPILARVVAPQPQPAAPPAGIPQRPAAAEKVELAVAANALISAAGQLESVAAALRSWGTSLDRVAKAAPAEAAMLRR